MKNYLIIPAMLVCVLCFSVARAQLFKFPCDRWVADPGIQSEYVKWLTSRGTAYMLIDSLRILNSTIPKDRLSELDGLKKEYNDNADRFNGLIDLTKKQVQEFELSIDPKKISIKQIKSFLATIKGHHGLSLQDDYNETLQAMERLTSRMENFKKSISPPVKGDKALGWIALAPVLYLLLEYYQDRESQKLDCLKWEKWI